MVCRLLSALVLVLTQLLAGPAHASGDAGELQPPPAGERPGGETKQLLQDGQLEYDLGHYRSALEMFERLYRKTALPGLLYNIAQCHRMLGELKEARATYRSFRAKNPENPYGPLADEKLAEIETALAAQSRAQTTPPVGLAPPHALGEAAVPPPREPRAAPPESIALPALPSRPIYRANVVTWSALGVGALLGAVGGYYGLKAHSLTGSDSVGQNSGGVAVHSVSEANQQSANTDASRANVLFAVAGVAALVAFASGFFGRGP